MKLTHEIEKIINDYEPKNTSKALLKLITHELQESGKAKAIGAMRCDTISTVILHGIGYLNIEEIKQLFANPIFQNTLAFIFKTFSQQLRIFQTELEKLKKETLDQLKPNPEKKGEFISLEVVKDTLKDHDDKLSALRYFSEAINNLSRVIQYLFRTYDIKAPEIILPLVPDFEKHNNIRDKIEWLDLAIDMSDSQALFQKDLLKMHFRTKHRLYQNLNECFLDYQNYMKQPEKSHLKPSSDADILEGITFLNKLSETIKEKTEEEKLKEITEEERYDENDIAGCLYMFIDYLQKHETLAKGFPVADLCSALSQFMKKYFAPPEPKVEPKSIMAGAGAGAGFGDEMDEEDLENEDDTLDTEKTIRYLCFSLILELRKKGLAGNAIKTFLEPCYPELNDDPLFPGFIIEATNGLDLETRKTIAMNLLRPHDDPVVLHELSTLWLICNTPESQKDLLQSYFTPLIQGKAERDPIFYCEELLHLTEKCPSSLPLIEQLLIFILGHAEAHKKFLDESNQIYSPIVRLAYLLEAKSAHNQAKWTEFLQQKSGTNNIMQELKYPCPKLRFRYHVMIADGEKGRINVGKIAQMCKALKADDMPQLLKAIYLLLCPESDDDENHLIPLSETDTLSLFASLTNMLWAQPEHFKKVETNAWRDKNFELLIQALHALISKHFREPSKELLDKVWKTFKSLLYNLFFSQGENPLFVEFLKEIIDEVSSRQKEVAKWMAKYIEQKPKVKTAIIELYGFDLNGEYLDDKPKPPPVLALAIAPSVSVMTPDLPPVPDGFKSEDSTPNF